MQGWGEEVTTTGYGTLQGGSDEDLWYTDQFNGTSSASPVVVGALACMQGILRAGGQPVLTAATARALLRSGDEKFAADDYAGALADFKAADLIMGVPTTRLSVAQSEEKLGRLLEARDTALSVACIEKTAGDPPAFEKARSDASALASALGARIPAVKLVVQGLPAGREVTVNLDGDTHGGKLARPGGGRGRC